MKTLLFSARNSSLSAFAAAVAAACLSIGSARAQTNAFDDAYHYTKQTWLTNLLNGGFGLPCTRIANSLESRASFLRKS